MTNYYLIFLSTLSFDRYISLKIDLIINVVMFLILNEFEID